MIHNFRMIPKRLRNEHGEFDLASVMVGATVLGIMTGVITAAVFGVIPWAQDNAAKQDLMTVRVAQSTVEKDHRKYPDEVSTEGPYLDYEGLRAAGYITITDSVVVDTDAAGKCYVAIAKSGSGDYYYVTDRKPDPVKFVDSLTDSNLGCSIPGGGVGLKNTAV
ncbi:type II secretion system protein [Arthrobacter sp. HLT1-21]